MKFIDEVKISVWAGDGGRGCVAFRREKYVPRGGPSGGDGGNGGSIVFVGNSRLSTLEAFRYRSHLRAKRGQHGQGSNCHGRSSPDLVFDVPLGTIIFDQKNNQLLYDIKRHGESYVVARGGRGGRGNARFVSSTNRAPRRADPGEPGEEKHLRLELKLLADVGIVGFPNAGKSTLVSAVSSARPLIADYPFTTLVPNLGVVSFGDYQSFVIADIPGLIPDAHKGAGLGDKFLKHVERSLILLHLLDLSPDTGRDPIEDYHVLKREIELFNPELSSRPQMIAGNKIDITGARDRLPRLVDYFGERDLPFYSISAATGKGVKQLINALGKAVVELKAET